MTVETSDTPGTRTRAFRSLQARAARVLGASSTVPIYIGIAVVLAGFALIAFTWGKVAGLGQVPLQLPYVVSGGLIGLGLVMVGLAIVSIQARRRDSAERARQMDRLGALLEQEEESRRGEES